MDGLIKLTQGAASVYERPDGGLNVFVTLGSRGMMLGTLTPAEADDLAVAILEVRRRQEAR